MKRYGAVKLGDKTHRPGCPCCNKKYTHSKHRGGKKRARQQSKVFLKKEGRPEELVNRGESARVVNFLERRERERLGNKPTLK